MLPYFFPDKLPVIAFAGILFTFAATCIFISKFAGFLPKDQGREFAVDGKKSAGEIAENFDMTNATISYHLSQLKKAGLVFESRYKNYIYYEINVSVFEEMMLWFSQFGGVSDEKK